MKKLFFLLFIIPTITSAQVNIDIKAHLYLKKLCDSTDKEGIIVETIMENLSDAHVFHHEKNFEVSLRRQGLFCKKVDFVPADKYQYTNSACWYEWFRSPYDIVKNYSYDDSLNNMFPNYVSTRNFINLRPHEKIILHNFISGDILNEIRKGKKFVINISINDNIFPLKYIVRKSIDDFFGSMLISVGKMR